MRIRQNAAKFLLDLLDQRRLNYVHFFFGQELESIVAHSGWSVLGRALCLTGTSIWIGKNGGARLVASKSAVPVDHN